MRHARAACAFALLITLTGCPTRTIYYDAGATGGQGGAGGVGGQAGSESRGGGGIGGRGAAGGNGGAGGTAGASGSGGGAGTGGAAGGAGTAGGAGSMTGAGGQGGAPHVCGDGTKDPGEDCDLGTAANEANAYGKGRCTTACKNAPYCGDGFINGPEVCDSAGSGSTDLGSCNPECTGYYEKKLIRETGMFYSTNLGGIAGADSICQAELGAGWKALLVGGTRRATVTPYVGDGQQDWVIAKYTHYYNVHNQLIWRTDDVPLLGVRAGTRQNLYATVFDNSNYPWAGWAADWTTLPDSAFMGTCGGWTATTTGYASFVLNDLATTASEPCGSSSILLCVQQ